MLVDSHNQWQAIDDELRRIEANLGRDIIELEQAWPDLQKQALALFGGSEASWAITLNKLGSNLETALAISDTPKARRFFITYRSQANACFCRADKELLTACNELRQIGDSLGLLLKAVDNEYN
jgi:hypothetical protein